MTPSAYQIHSHTHISLKPNLLLISSMTTFNLTGETISIFKKSLSPDASVLTENDEGYEESLVRWADTAIRRAQLVVQPTNAEDVSKTVKFAVENKIPFVVKGGGHSPSGASSSNGLVIDLSKNLNKIAVDKEKKLVTVGGGAVWGDVHAATDEYGLATVGGTVSHTGVGGFTLGGGYGLLTGQYGLTADNVESVEIVTADGEVKIASETENKDLFWAVRGYGKAFGVVTKFVFRAHELTNQVFAGSMIFPGDKLEAVISASNKFLENQSPKSLIIIVFMRPPFLKGAASIACLVFHNGTEEEANSVFAPLVSLEPIVQQTAMMPFKNANTLQDRAAGYGDRKMFGSANLKTLSYPTVQRAFDKYVSLAEKHPDAIASVISIDLTQKHGILQHARDEMAFNWRDSNFNVAMSFRWKDPELDAVIPEWVAEIQAIFHENGDARRLYSNYTDGLADVRDEVGDNYERLKALKSIYDPSTVFPKI